MNPPRIPALRRTHHGDDLLHHRNHRATRGVCYSHREIVLHELVWPPAWPRTSKATLNPEDVYMPITPMFHVRAGACPTLHRDGPQTVYRGVRPGLAAGARREER